MNTIISKIIILIILIIGIFGCNPTTKNFNQENDSLPTLEDETEEVSSVEFSNLVCRNNTYYLINSKVPYSGYVYSLHSNNQLELEFCTVDGKITGNVIHYYNNGSKKLVQTYKNGILNGNWIEYNSDMFNNSVSLTKTFKDGKLEGTVTKYTILEDIEYQEIYKNGSKIEYRKYEHGKIYEILKFIVENSCYKRLEKLTYYENGKLRSNRNYENNESHGVYREWHENGNLLLIGTFNNRKQEGVWERYSSDGVCIASGEFKDGSLVKTTDIITGEISYNSVKLEGMFLRSSD